MKKIKDLISLEQLHILRQRNRRLLVSCPLPYQLKHR